jgi:hypothetical protein
MPGHFSMPDEFQELAEWCSRVGFVRNGYGYLADPDEGDHCLVVINDPLRTGWEGYLADPDRLWFVANTGGEGSSICLWLDDDGNQQVVHHGSGSGSILFATLPSPLAVLRLFAVGYEEPCWNCDWADPPEGSTAALEPFRRWARERWGIVPARTGVEALDVAEAVDEWTSLNGPDTPFLGWLAGPGTSAPP